MIRPQMEEMELIYPHLVHSIRALRRKISQCKSMREVSQVLEPYGINLFIIPLLRGLSLTDLSK